MFGSRLERRIKRELRIEQSQLLRERRSLRLPRVRVRITAKHVNAAFKVGKGVYRALQHPEKYFHV